MRLNNWAAIIDECNKSNMTKKAWCLANNINEKQFFYWQRLVRMHLVQELDTSTTPTKFVEVPVPLELQPIKTDQPATHSAQLNSDAIIHIKDFTIEISNSISSDLLDLLIKAISHA